MKRFSKPSLRRLEIILLIIVFALWFLGVSGGIDSTVVAAICCEVNKQTNIPLIGRSLPIKNKKDEFDVSKLVGEAFCNNFDVANLYDEYKYFLSGHLVTMKLSRTL